MAGIVHAFVLLSIMLVFGRWASMVPMCCLAGLRVRSIDSSSVFGAPPAAGVTSYVFSFCSSAMLIRSMITPLSTTVTIGCSGTISVATLK